MKKILLLLSISLLLILTGCSIKELSSDESKNWRVEYEVAAYNKADEETSGSITYIGKEAPPKKVSYILKNSSRENSGEYVSLEEGELNILTGSCQGCKAVPENEQMEVEVNWNDKKETFILKHRE